MRLIALVPLLAVVSGCHRASPPAPTPPAPPEPWSIVCNSPPPEGIYLSNGLMGLKVGPLSDGTGSDGESLPLYRADRYAGLSIAPQPNPLMARFIVNRNPIRPDMGKGYRQELGMKDGLLQTRYRWRAGRVQGSVSVGLFLSRAVPEVASVRYSVSVDRECTLKVVLAPTGEEADIASVIEAARQIVLCRYAPSGAMPSYWSSAASSRGGSGKLVFDGEHWAWSGRLRSGDRLVLEHSIRLTNPEEPAEPPGFEEALSDSKAAWSELWRGDIEIDGSVADQQLVRSWLFNLYQTCSAGFFPPMGFSSDWYGGRIFWDQEVWMLPALLPFHPKAVEKALAKRVALLPKAVANAQAKGFEGALYPWESTPNGDEGAPPEFQQEIHITGDVLFAARQALDWGIGLQGYPELARRVAEFWASRLENGHIRRVISPDEGEVVDDDLYTNALAAWCLREAARHHPPKAREWRALADGIYFPRDADGLFLTYEGDKVVSYKQAAALLTLYPLGMSMDVAGRERMFDRYKDKVIETGPAMADAIHSIIAARLGRREEAERLFRESYERFMNSPGLQFSEKRKGTPRTYFLTGAGGCLQAVLYGFAGLEVLPPGAAPQARGDRPNAEKLLSGGYTLRAGSMLPARWSSLTLKGVRLRGKIYDIRLTHNEVRIDEGG
ncbi:MAG: glycoside hydrolase family 65 protein [Fimbriimonadia bacterium]